MNQQQQVQQLLQHGAAFQQSALTGKRPALQPNQALIFSYAVAIARIRYDDKLVYINSRKYSQTTSKHQNLVQREAIKQGYTIEHLFTSTASYNDDYMVWTRL